MAELPQEIEVWYVIPAIRRELAKALLRKGLAQNKIASLLGITEAAVSQYLHDKRAKEIVFDKALQKKTEEVALRLTKTQTTALEAVKELCDCARNKKLLCKIHRKRADVPAGCNICIK